MRSLPATPARHRGGSWKPSSPPFAHLAGVTATGLRDVTHDPAALDSAGFWIVVVSFEGEVTCARFDELRPGPPPRGAWLPPPPTSWRSSLEPDTYRAGVTRVREHIAAGAVYQVNLCRVLTAPLPEPGRATVAGLGERLTSGNPAPYAALVELPGHGLRVASASPELFLGREGRTVQSRPIKGTARTAAGLVDKDRAENVMIVDLVRNDLGRVAVPGSVRVPGLCELEHHPGLVHLVSAVRAELAPTEGWPELLAATFPPGSVSGAPKSTALGIIDLLEPVPRGLYCGAVGWVDADSGRGELAVGIRTFWIEGEELKFGTGAGITWDSEPDPEWAETELKATRLVATASADVSARV